jgi:CBS domain-containing protein
MAQTLKDLMTPDPATCESQTSIADVARLMKEQDIGNVILLEDGQVTGIVTDRDIVVRGLAEGRDVQAPVADVASRDLVTLSPDDDVQKAVQVMRERAVRRLPVVENGRPVGIVSIGDLAIERDSDSALADISVAPGNR